MATVFSNRIRWIVSLEALARLRNIDEKVVIYGDALNGSNARPRRLKGLPFEAHELRLLDQGKLALDSLLRVPLISVSNARRGIRGFRGRTILADDMGLGKTIQAIGAAEMLARRRGISRGTGDLSRVGEASVAERN